MAIAIAAVLAGTLAGHTQSTRSPALLVLSKADETLSIVNPSNLMVTARVPSGPDPHEVVASPDGRFAYISNYGGGAYNTLTVVDLETRNALPPVDLGSLRGPHGLHFAGGRVWFTAEAARSIGTYDPSVRKVDWTLSTGQNGTHMIWVARDLAHVVTTNIGSASVSLIDKQPGNVWKQTVVGVGPGAEGFDVSPDGKEIWVANAGDGTVSIVEAASQKVMALAANVQGANRLKFTPDGHRVLISTLRGPDLTVLDAGTRREIKRVPVGRGAAGIQIQPDGARAYVACTPDGYVAIVDLASLETIGRIQAGRQPDGLAWVAGR